MQGIDSLCAPSRSSHSHRAHRAHRAHLEHRAHRAHVRAWISAILDGSRDCRSLQQLLLLLRALLSLLFERASRDRALALVEAREALAGPVTVGDAPESPRSLTGRGTAARCCCCGCCSARCCRCPSSARRETARSRLSRRGRPSPVLSLPRDVVGVACRRGVVFMFMFVHESPRPVVGSRDCRLQLLPLLLLLLPSRAGSHIGIVAQHAGALAGVILSSWRVTDLRWAWAAFRCETRAQPSSNGVGTASSPVCPLIRRHSLCVQASRERSSRDRSRSASRSRDA